MSIENLRAASEFLKTEWGPAPKIAVILGSGLSTFAKTLTGAQEISCEKLPGAVRSHVEGHAGRIYFGQLGKQKVLVQAGRVHGYEGHEPHQVVHNLRAYQMWGVEKFILTNAAGSTKKTYKPGDLVFLKDHINFTARNPLVGLETYRGPRFPDMSDAYSKAWLKRALNVARKAGISMKTGVYAAVLGPNYETAAEIRMFAKLGADLVGMSTVWETLAVKQMGAEVLGISCVTNYGTGVSKLPLSHQEVLDTTQKVQSKFKLLIENLIKDA